MRIVSDEPDEIRLAFDRAEIQRLVEALESAVDEIYRSDMLLRQKRAEADRLWGWIDRLNSVIWDNTGVFDEEGTGEEQRSSL